MKLVSWNVNGLRSTEKHFLEFLKDRSPDIVLLQEIRSHPNHLSFFLKLIPGYNVKFNHSGRPGYAGTAIYHKENIAFDKISFSAGDNILDSEGRTIFCRLGNLIILNFYTPNGNSNKERFEFKLKFYKAISDFVENLLNSGYSIIIGGDLNVAYTKLDVFAPQNYKNHSGFLPVERSWFGGLLGLGFVDSFRLFEKDGGHYTWWHMRDPKRKENRGWRYDYFLVSNDLAKKVKQSKILKNVFGSDHCPIALEIEINSEPR